MPPHLALPVPRGVIYQDQNERRRIESRNGVLQFEFVLDQVQAWNADSRFTPGLICELQRLAANQMYRCAGHFRDGEVRLEGADHKPLSHQPPPHTEVPGLVEEMCDYVHQKWDKTALHLAAFVMWRVNWIHPFFGGNGRTARAASYLILCARLGFAVPGAPTIPELIVSNRQPYFTALRAADEAAKQGRLDVTAMEELIESLLARQLLSIHENATGRRAFERSDRPETS